MKTSEYDISDADQFRKANQSVYERMKTDSVFKESMQKRYPGLYEHVQPLQGGTFRGDSPPKLTWHHNDSPGLLELVDRAEHRKFHKIYHPDGSGGRKKWGGGTGCR